MDKRLPVTIVTGFLGAGKTTLLSGLLNVSRKRRLALLINEFGEVDFDGGKLEQAERPKHTEIIQLPGGLLAYGDGNDFMPAMLRLAERKELFDHVLLETSGLASPSAAMVALQAEPLKSLFRLDATLAVVDTPLLLEGEFSPQASEGVASELFEVQLNNADVIVLNKIDGLDDKALLKAEQEVRNRAPGIRFLELAFEAKLDPQLALGLHLHGPSSSLTPYSKPSHHGFGGAHPLWGSQPLADQTLVDGHEHDGLGAHVHGDDTHEHFHEADPGWQSFTLHCHGSCDAEKAKAALSKICKGAPIFRVKGYLQTPGGSRVALQGVRERFEITPADAAEGAEGCQLVVIGYHPERRKIAAALEQATGAHWH